jgi:thymidine phosphorylase
VLISELIRRKRDGGELTPEEIEFLVEGITDGSVSDAQVGALAMAILLQGMTRDERIALTGAKTRSGEVLDWSDAGLQGPALDKHSTGGVGDKVSLLLAPIVAACGGAVPMISGRGLGHTGGTLDKLESIPGYDTAPDPAAFRRAVASAGCAIVGQTAELAPADRRLYAIRDATGTVESVHLIVASILSKKLAAGLDALVMDVKVGSGAFLPGVEQARELAVAIVEVAQGNGLPTSALLTDMDRVLGRTAGNAVEVLEAVSGLTDPASLDGRLREVTLALSAELLVLGDVEADLDAARSSAERALDSGAAAERFAAMVSALGGPSDLLEAPGRSLPTAAVRVEVLPESAGTVESVDVRAVGLAVVALGGGRTRETDPVDHSVGLTDVAAPGEAVGPGDRPLAVVHAADPEAADRAAGALRAAYTLGDPPPEAPHPCWRRFVEECGPRSAPYAVRLGAHTLIPKAELHVHLEGTAPPALIRRLAERSRLPVPAGVFDGPDRFAYTDFLDFLRTYDLAASVIRTAEDYRDVTYEYLASCALDGAIYVELIVSPDHAAAVKLDPVEHLQAIARGIDDARSDHGIESRILLTAIRNLGVDHAIRTARYAASKPHPYVVGFQLAGDEASYPAHEFNEAFHKAAEAGLGCSIHAGEWAGPESVRAALELPITRIGHGVRSIEDRALVEELAARGTVLECCPTSNVVLGLFPSYQDHPLPALADAGVKVTLASDDPPYFGASIGGEYDICREWYGFGDDRLRAITKTAIEAAFCEKTLKQSLMLRV